MKTTLLVVGLGLVLAACADDGGSMGPGSGDDTLPKRGELATDPTIVSATARCSACASEECFGSDPANSHIRVRVDASDMGGSANLGSCAGTMAALSDQDSYEGGTCSLFFKTPCTAGSPVTVGLTVSNDKGGVTTASVKLTVVAD
jgi:hypothetical protein